MSYLEEMKHLKDAGFKEFNGDYLLVVDEQNPLNQIMLPIKRGSNWRIHVGYTTGQEGMMAYCEDVDWGELEYAGDIDCESRIQLVATEEPSNQYLQLHNSFTLDLESFHRPFSVYVIKRNEMTVALYIESVDEELIELPLGEFKTVSPHLYFTDPANVDDSLIVPVTANVEWTVTGFLDETETLIRVEGRANLDSFTDISNDQDVGEISVLSAFISVFDEIQLQLTPQPATDHLGSPLYVSLMSLMGEQQEAVWDHGVVFLTEGGSKQYPIRGCFQENQLVLFSIDLFEEKTTAR